MPFTGDVWHMSWHPCYAINSSPPGQNGRHFAKDIFKWIFMNEMFCISIQILLKFVPGVLIDNNRASVEIMAWRRIGDKPISEPVLTWITGAYMRHYWGGDEILVPVAFCQCTVSRLHLQKYGSSVLFYLQMKCLQLFLFNFSIFCFTFSLDMSYTLIDYVRGGCDLRLIVAIDFTVRTPCKQRQELGQHWPDAVSIRPMLAQFLVKSSQTSISLYTPDEDLW